MSKISYQFDEHSCALSSLRTLCCLKTKKRGWKNLTFPSSPPYSLKNLEEGMSANGFDLRFYKSEKEEFSYPFDKDGPFLALLDEKEGIHMVVITNIEKDEVTYLDPISGENKVKKEKFLSLWNGCWGTLEQYLVIKPPKKRRIIPLWQNILTDSLLFLSEIALGFAFAFLDRAPLYLTLICFVLYILLEEGRRLLILYLMKLFDKKYLNSLYSSDSKRLKANYERYNALKKNLFADTASLMSQIGSSILIAVIVGVNNPPFFLSLGGVLALLCGEKLIFHRYFSLKSDRLIKEEKALFESKDEPEKRQLLFSLSSDADKYGKMMLLEKAIITVFIMIFSLLPSLMANDSSLNFYLFHLFALLLIERGGSEAFSYIFSHKEREINALYFKEYIAKPRP